MKIKEGDAYASMQNGELVSVIIDRNDERRLCYWVYCSVDGKFVYHEIGKPSLLARNHLNFIKEIAKEEEQSV